MFDFLRNSFAFEVIFLSLFLICIMLYNRFTLYKADFFTPLTCMLFAGAGYCLSELLWLKVFDDGVFSPVAAHLAYFFYLAFSLASCIYFVVLIVEGLFGWPRSRRALQWIVLFPFALCVLLYVSFLFKIQGLSLQASGYVYNLFTAMLTVSVFPFLVAGIVIPLFILLKNRKKDKELCKKAADYLFYGIIANFILLLQVLIFDHENWFFCIGTSCALCFLTIRQSTNTLVKEETERSVREADMGTAAKIQLSALPKNSPAFAHHNEIVVDAAMFTEKEVGGDFYDYFELGNERVCFLMADVSGKGIPAALFMMRVKTIIKDLSAYYCSTSELFEKVNSTLCEDNNELMFATAWIGILDTQTLVLQFTNAGHNYPYLSKRGGKFQVMKSKHGPSLGIFRGAHYKQTELQLEVGDRVLLYTDGLTEAHNKAEEMYSDERLEKTLNDIADVNGAELLARLKASADAFADGAPQYDDITMLTVSVGERA